jgi:hypothetical protein
MLLLGTQEQSCRPQLRAATCVNTSNKRKVEIGQNSNAVSRSERAKAAKNAITVDVLNSCDLSEKDDSEQYNNPIPSRNVPLSVRKKPTALSLPIWSMWLIADTNMRTQGQ